MTTPRKNPALAEVDIQTLETIYADGRALGQVINDLKSEIARVRAENVELKTALSTMRFRLQSVTDLYEKAMCGEKAPATPRGLPRSLRPGPLHGPGITGPFEKRGTKRDTAPAAQRCTPTHSTGTG